METILLRDYVVILKKQFIAFLAVIILCVGAAAVLTFAYPKNYTSSIDVYIRHSEAQSSGFYTYDGYYSTQASVQYTNTVAGFLESLSTIDNAALIVQSDPLYKQGGFKPEDLESQTDYLAKFQKNINVQIVAPQLINVSVHDANPVVARLWAQSLGTVITDKLKTLNQQGNISFNIDTIHDPLTQTNTLNLYLDLAIGLIVGIALGFTFGFILEASKKDSI